MTNPAEMNPRSIDTLLAIMKALRTPGTGCPWDLEQDFATIAPYTIEEAYEVADAIQRGDRADLCEELGDLLLQPVYHAQMAAEEGSFTFGDVIEAICRKMIRRHPHVFGDAQARSAKLAKGFWEEMKAREAKPAKTASPGSPALAGASPGFAGAFAGASPEGATLAGIALALPGLTRAVKLQARAAKVGFDWPHIDQVYDKIEEELSELQTASESHREEEFGDLLFVMANLARHMGIDPESAIRGANAKFERRFSYIEEQLEKSGKKPSDSSLAEMDALWDEAKSRE